MPQEQKKETVLKLASLWKRAVAFSIDFLFISLLKTITARLLSFLTLSPGASFGRAVFRWLLLTRFVQILYEVVFLSTWGQTIGKRVFKLIVVTEKEAKIPSWERAAFRSVLRLIPLEFLACLFTVRKQCLHDLIAKTVVVDKK
ncbi:RDD family protein [Patescibacteria group bacterium]